MAKILEASSAVHENLSFTVNGEGQLTSVNASVRVAYNGVSVRQQNDIWPELSSAQREQLQAIYETIAEYLQEHYLD